MNESILIHLLHGQGAHVDPVEAFEDLPFEFAGRRIPHCPHTIWQLLFHVNFWIDYELRWIEDSQTPRLEDWSVSWPKEDGPSDESSYRKAASLLRSNIDELVALAQAQASTRARISGRWRYSAIACCRGVCRLTGATTPSCWRGRF